MVHIYKDHRSATLCKFGSFRTNILETEEPGDSDDEEVKPRSSQTHLRLVDPRNHKQSSCSITDVVHGDRFTSETPEQI